MSLNIALDLDGVFSNFHYSFSIIANKLFGSPIIMDIDQIKSYQWEDWGYPLNKEQHNKVWEEVNKNTPNFWYDMLPLISPEEFSKLLDVINEGHNFFFITSRKNTVGGSVLNQTNKWIKKNLAIDNFSVIPAHKKGQVIEAIEADYFLDDMPENVIDALVKAPKCESFLLNRPYNAYAIEFIKKTQNYKKIKIVYSVGEFLDLIDEDK